MTGFGVTTYNKSTQTAIPYAVPYQHPGSANYFSTFAQPYAPVVYWGWTLRWANFGTGGAGGALGTGTTSNLNIVLTDPN